MQAGAAPRAAIFDLDGTIVDSEPGSQAALRQLFGQYAVPFSDELIAQFVGRRGAEVFAELDLFPGRDPAELADEVGRIHQAMDLPAALPFPGAVRLLREIRLAGDPLGLVTSGGRWYAVPRLRQLGLLELFAVVVTADDVTAGKPDPQGYLRACRELGVAASSCAVFEDSPAGVAAAKAGGLYCVAVTTTHRPSQLGQADRVVADLAEVSWPLALADFRLSVRRRPARGDRRVLPWSAPQQAEGMACGVRADPPAASVHVKQRGAEVDGLLLSLVEVRDVKVQMELLRARGARPLRCPVIGHPLEREYET